MKAVFISYNQALTEKVADALEKLTIRGYTQWTEVKGRGSVKGEPHLGTHTWPAMNNTILTVVEDDQSSRLLKELKKVNDEAESQGLRAFVWDVSETI